MMVFMAKIDTMVVPTDIISIGVFAFLGPEMD